MTREQADALNELADLLLQALYAISDGDPPKDIDKLVSRAENVPDFLAFVEDDD